MAQTGGCTMRMRGWMPVVLLAVVMNGCSREEPAQEQSGPEQTGELPEDNVFRDQVKTLEKAQDVQKTLDAGAARTRESVERQERP